ncbi:kinase-like domain-containing protein, partial [Mycena galericulata]
MPRIRHLGSNSSGRKEARQLWMYLGWRMHRLSSHFLFVLFPLLLPDHNTVTSPQVYHLPPPMPSATVPCQYRTGKTLRSGAYALWKEAIHIKTRKFYACKVINKKDMQGREYLVQNEIAVLKRMQKGIPNVVKLHDYFETAHNVYLCLDLCTGGTLFDRIKANGAYSDGKAAGLIRDILIAVKHIHDSGVIHRDLRPETVFFCSPAETSTFVIADFGLSRMVEEAPHSHGELEIDGSSLCMAPEIILQEKHGKPVDIWAVGVLAFFLLVGCTPFDRETAKLQRDSIIAGEYKLAPDGKWGALSVNARDFISMCLLIDPDRRPAAKEALTHTWLIPPTPRFVRVESRPNSFLELHSAFRRVFNPKRKWRILGLTIKALNRMHTLAGHALPSTQPDMEESAQQTLADSSSTYFKGDDSESFQPQPPEDEIKDFPSPVSSVYILDDRKSWLTKGSMSTAPTDEEEPAEASLHMP